MDRFLLKTVLSYPKPEQEIEIMKKFTVSQKQDTEIERVLSHKELQHITEIIEKIYVSDNIFEYVKDIVFSSRFPQNYGLDDLI